MDTMEQAGTLVLKRSEVAKLLTVSECIDAVEQAFRLYADGKAMPPKLLGLHTTSGGFHIKAGILKLKQNYFIGKTNANFPLNAEQNGLPAIQGIITVFDGENGRLLALMDSIEITIIRTGAATGVAAKYLSLKNANSATICGCGNQGEISLKALMNVRQLKKVFAFDIDELQTQKFVHEFFKEIEVIPITLADLPAALSQSRILVTCTPAKKPFIHAEHIMPGTFIAAVGADSEEKQELFSELLASNKVVADIAVQSAEIGELHHAIQQGLMGIEDIHAELGFIVTGKKPGRESDEEIIIFDSTGTALQDVAAAAIVYEKALAKGIETTLNLAE